jgi:hypothetical protein
MMGCHDRNQFAVAAKSGGMLSCAKLLHQTANVFPSWRDMLPTRAPRLRQAPGETKLLTSPPAS